MEHKVQFDEYIAPCLRSSHHTIQKQIILSLIAAQNTNIAVNDKVYLSYCDLDIHETQGYIKMSEIILQLHGIRISPTLFRTVLLYIQTNERIHRFWCQLYEYSAYITDNKTKFLIPPISQCPCCNRSLHIVNVSVFQCVNENNIFDHTVCEVSMRCRKNGCNRKQLTVNYNYYRLSDGSYETWGGEMAGTDRHSVLSVHLNKLVYIPDYIRFGSLFYTWQTFNHMIIDNVNGKCSYSTMSKSMKLKTFLRKIQNESTIDYDLYGKDSKFDSRHIFNAYILFRCIWFCNLVNATKCNFEGFNHNAMKKLIIAEFNEHERFIQNKNIAHKTDIYGCFGKIDGVCSPQIVSDGLCLIVVLVCGSFKHRRTSRQCYGTPPGRGRRVYCDHPECRINEHKCRALMPKTRELCPNWIADVRKHHCTNHNEYTPGCAVCHEIIVPSKFFCKDHKYMEKDATAKLKRDKQHFHKKKQDARHGGKRSYARSRHCLDNEVKEEDEFDAKWTFTVGKVYTHGYIFVVCVCGVILDAQPMLRGEGAKQHINMICELFGSQLKLKHYCWIDIGCKALKVVINDKQLTKAFENTKIIVDRFHGYFKHNQKGDYEDLNKFCLQYCDVSTMSKEKLKQKYPTLIGVNDENLGNSSAAE
eukprot:208876_1